MSESHPPQPPVDLATAHRIILNLVDALTASSDLIALMARMLGEEGARPLQTQPEWASYLEAKRKLETVHGEMHRFAEAATAQMKRESAVAADPAPHRGARDASEPPERERDAS